MDYFIIAVVTLAGLYFHWWLYVRIRRWTDRDLALSLGEDDKDKRAYMLQRLEQARSEGIKRRDLSQWLQRAADDYRRD
ncbi:hypothetical protein [Pseudomonas sp.]|uniref:hypothetical protein n=1 Tax=Pseudomonas sp. TaxID=306 RepID=UPI0028AAE625|nr:hypothetical protein [Pseudomonas sp.]